MDTEEFLLERLELSPLPELIRRLRVKRASGTLILQEGQVSRRVQFLHGDVSLAQSNQIGERLNSSLRMKSSLQKEMSEYLGRMDGREPFGALLTRFGVVSRAAVTIYLRELTIKILANSISRKEGTAAFESGVYAVSRDLFLSTPTPPLLLEVIRKCSSLGVLSRTLEINGRKFDWVPHAQDHIPLSLSPAEYFVVSRFEGHTFDVSEAEQVVPDRLLVHRTLVGLLLAGWLSPHQDAEQESGSWAVADEATRSLVELVERMEGMNYYEFLGIPSAASQAEIKNRHEELKAFYMKEQGTAEYKFYRRKILIKLDEAAAILGEPDRRKGYDKMLTGSPTRQATRDMIERRELQKAIAKTNYEKARSLLEEEDVFSAIQLLEQAVIFDPENADYLWLLGFSQLKNPRWTKEAADTFQKVVTVDPSRSEAWVELGKIYLTRKMYRRAEGCFAEAIRYDKDLEEAREGLRKAKGGPDEP